MSWRDRGRVRPAGRARPVAPTAAARRTARLRVRDLGPDDGHVVDVILGGMSDRSRYLRFHGPMPQIPDSVRRALAAVDGHRHVAVAVEVRRNRTWHPVGLGRIVIDTDGTAELAVSVVDAWQGRGIGTRIVRALRDRARTLGIQELVAEVMVDNAPMLRVLRRELPAHRTQRSGGVLRMVCHVPGPWDLTLTHEDLISSLVA